MWTVKYHQTCFSRIDLGISLVGQDAIAVAVLALDVSEDWIITNDSRGRGSPSPPPCPPDC